VKGLEADIVTSCLRGVLEMAGRSVQSVAWTRDNKIAASDYDGNVYVWQRTTGARIASFRRRYPALRRASSRRRSHPRARHWRGHPVVGRCAAPREQRASEAVRAANSAEAATTKCRV
jgi:hypothetical protein